MSKLAYGSTRVHVHNIDTRVYIANMTSSKKFSFHRDGVGLAQRAKAPDL